jgi:hypothetical protein
LSLFIPSQFLPVVPAAHSNAFPVVNVLLLCQRRPLRFHQFDDPALGMIHHLQ